MSRSRSVPIPKDRQRYDQTLQSIQLRAVSPDGADEADDEYSEDGNYPPGPPANSPSTSLVAQKHLLSLPGYPQSRLTDGSSSSFISSVSQHRETHASYEEFHIVIPDIPDTDSSNTPKVYQAPGRARNKPEPSYTKSFNNSNIIRNYKKPELLDTRNFYRRPATTGAIRKKPQKVSIFRHERDLSDDEFERVQRLSRPTISSSCRESTVRIPKPDHLIICRPTTTSRKQASLPLIKSVTKPRFSGKKKVNHDTMKDIVDRLHRFNPDKIPDARRIAPKHVRSNPDIVNSHLWMGIDYSYRIHNGPQGGATFNGFEQNFAKLTF